MKLNRFSASNGIAPLRTAAISAILSCGGLIASQAHAGCLDVTRPKHVAYHSDSHSQDGSWRFVNTDYKDGGHESWQPPPFFAPIVGLWEFTYTSKGNSTTLGIPDGAPIDAGATTWFADGNEFTYSGVRNPIVGATCLGIWKRTGEFTYVLNHVGLSWDPTLPYTVPADSQHPNGGPGATAGPAFIKQYLVLAPDAESYSGTFTITNLQPDGKTQAGPVIRGTIKATRVHIETDTWEPTP